MRTNIVIDEDLMAEVMRLTGVRTKKGAVELALQTLVRMKKQERIRDWRGRLNWEGDLEDMRSP